MSNLFYEQLEKDYELGDVKEEFLRQLAQCLNRSKWPEDVEYEVYELIERFPQLYSIGSNEVTYNG